jgi:ribosomal-protein-alanine N-acetyltransferase
MRYSIVSTADAGYGGDPTMPPLPPLPEPLRDELASIRLAAERDIPEVLIAHQDDPSLADALGLGRPPSGAELGRAIEQTEPRLSGGAGATLTITSPGEDECVGQVEVDPVDPDHERTDLRVWVAPAARGHGLGRAALRLASTWLLTAAGLQRVQLLVDPGNEAMLRAAAAAGFTGEGRLREYVVRRGRRIDVDVLSRIAEDLDR